MPLSTGIAGLRVSVLEPGSYVVVLLLCVAGVAATIWQMAPPTTHSETRQLRRSVGL